MRSEPTLQSETYRRYIDQTHKETTNGCGHRYLPVLARLELIAYDRHNGALQCHNRANAQHEQHKEEQRREELRHSLKFRYGIRIGYERQAGSTAHHIPYIIHLQIMRQIAKYGKYRNTTQQTSQRIQCGHNHGIPVKCLIRGIELSVWISEPN